MRFPSFRRKPEPPPKPIREKKEGCKIKVKRDEEGRIKEISTNGMCSKTDIEIFKEQNGLGD